MEGLEEILTIGSKFFSQGWLLGLLFLWMLRHDVLTPLGKALADIPVTFHTVIQVLEAKVQADKDVALKLEGIEKALLKQIEKGL